MIWSLYSNTEEIEDQKSDTDFPKVMQLVRGRPVCPDPGTIYSQPRAFHSTYPDLLYTPISPLIEFGNLGRDQILEFYGVLKTVVLQIRALDNDLLAWKEIMPVFFFFFFLIAHFHLQFAPFARRGGGHSNPGP